MLQTNSTAGARSLDAAPLLDAGPASGTPEHVDPLLWKLAGPAEREALRQSGQPGQNFEPHTSVADRPGLPTLPGGQPASASNTAFGAGTTAPTTKSPAAGTTSASDQALIVKATDQFRARFSSAAQDSAKFNEMLRKAFGDNHDAKAAEGLRQQALKNDFSWMPKIEVVAQSQLADLSGTQGEGVGKGAYSQSNDTVYLSREMLTSDPAMGERVLCEEIGHSIDARLNTQDAVGDEGDIFSALLHGDAVTDAELQTMRADNDHGTINVNGQRVEVEYGFFKKLVKKISGAVKSVGKFVANTAKAVTTVVVGIATFDADKVKEGFKDGVRAVKTFATDAINFIKDEWKDLKDNFKKIMQSKVFAAVLAVCRFIPIPIVQVVVRVIDLVKAGYSVYQGVKAKSFGAVLSGVAGVVGGVSNFAGALGASASTVKTLQTVASTARTASMAYNAAATKDFGQAAMLAANVFGAPKGVKDTIRTAQQVQNVVKAVEKHDYAGALAGTATLAGGTAGQTLGVSAETAKTLQSVANTVQTADAAYKAVQHKNYAGAAMLAADAFGASQETKETIKTVNNVIKAAEKHDYKAALASGSALFGTSAKEGETPREEEGTLKGAARTAGTILKAVNAKEYGEAAVQVADALHAPAGVTDSLKTAQQVEKVVQAVRRHDYAAAGMAMTEIAGERDAAKKDAAPPVVTPARSARQEQTQALTDLWARFAASHPEH